MTDDQLKSFKRQLEVAQRAAGARGEVVYGYHWREGRLSAMTRKASRPVPPPPLRNLEERRARRGAVAVAMGQGNLL